MRFIAKVIAIIILPVIGSMIAGTTGAIIGFVIGFLGAMGAGEETNSFRKGRKSNGFKGVSFNENTGDSTEDVIKDRIKGTVEKISPVTFKAHWQHYMIPKVWTDLRVYLYNGLHGEEKVEADLDSIEQPDRFDFETSGPAYLKVGTEIKIKPEIPDFRFAPKEMIVEWYKDWVPVVFRMMTELAGPFPKSGKKVKGKVKFFVGPLLINEIDINVTVKDLLLGDEKFTRNKKEKSAYRKIFPSYSHRDKKIVEKIEKTYSAFGDEYMRDVKKLRCGQKWQPEILKLIKEADVFHLFWSYASKKSRYVRKEWEEALKQNKEDFIRPVYWEEPMPKPPPELGAIQFSELDF